MKTVYFLAGFGGNELSKTANGDVVWINYVALAGGEIGKLRLAANGFEPGRPDGISMTAGGPLPKFYGEAIERLANQMKSDGYRVVPVAYDWRKSLTDAGNRFAAQILNEINPTEPCTIVGHSTGGLVARWAYGFLVGEEKAALVRRIITLGAPHLGTYAAVALLSGARDELDGISLLNCLASRGFLPVNRPPSGEAYWTVYDLQKLVATWPGIYQLFPFFNGDVPPTDPDREKLYDASNWYPRLLVSQDFLNKALNPWQTTLTDPANIPPPHVLTQVAGFGLDTLSGLVRSNVLGTPEALTSLSRSGDGTVVESSALALPGPKIRVHFGHMDLPIHTVEEGILRREVLTDRVPPIPPTTPPEVYQMIQFPSIIEPSFPRPRFAPIPFPTRQAWDSVRDP